jgi:hypothetical protein
MEHFDELDIMESLYQGLDVLDSLLKSSNDKEYATNFENLYLTEYDVYENNIHTYLSHMDNCSGTNLWVHLTTIISKDVIKSFMDKFLEYLVGIKDVQKTVNILTKLITPLDINVITHDQSNTIFNMLTKNINLSNWSDEVTVIYMFLDMNNLLTSYINWAEHFENKYRVKMNIDINDRYIPELPDSIIANITGILLTAWSFCEDVNIDPLYIMNKSCQIQWYDRKYNKKEYNNASKLFYSILNCFRVGIIPICYRYKQFKTEIDKMNNLLGNGQIGFMTRLISQQKLQYEKYFDEAKKIVQIYELPNLINNFYVQTFHIFKTMKIDYDIVIDDIFNDMSYYMICYNKLQKKSFLTKDYCHFILDVIISKTYTNNVSIKYDFLSIIAKTINKLNMGLHVDLLVKYAECSIILHNEIQQSNISQQHQIEQQLQIYKFINKTLNLKEVKFDNVMLSTLVKNCNITKKMLHNMLTNLSDIDDANNKLYKDIVNMQGRSMTAPFIQKLEEQIGVRFKVYTNIFSFFTKFIILMIGDQTLIQILLSDEILSSLTTNINQNVNRLCDINFKVNMNFRYYKGFSLDINEYVTNIMNILNILNNNCDMSTFTCDHIFHVENYDKLQKYVKNIQYDNIFEKLHNENMNDDDCEYPDEYLDPITFSKIKEPQLIPNMNGFEDLYFDKSTIMKQLLVKEENPYTRAPLTLKEFEDYNNLEEIKLKCQKFKDQIINYKNKM